MPCRTSLLASILGRKMSKLSIWSNNMAITPSAEMPNKLLSRRKIVLSHRLPGPGLLTEQRDHLSPHGIPHLPEGGQDFFVRAGGLGRVRKADVHDFGFPGKDGT